MNYSEPNLKIFLRYIARHKKLFYIDMSCAVLVAVIDLIFPYASRQSMNALCRLRMPLILRAVALKSFVGRVFERGS